MIDERFFQHRLKSTSLAAVTGGVSMGAYCFYELFHSGRVPLDVVIFLGIMAATKITAMIYYRFVN